MNRNHLRHKRQQQSHSTNEKTAVTLQVRWKCNHSEEHQSGPSLRRMFCTAEPLQNRLSGFILPITGMFNVQLRWELCFQSGTSRKAHLTPTGCGKGSLNGLPLSATSQSSFSVWDVNLELNYNFFLLRFTEISMGWFITQLCAFWKVESWRALQDSESLWWLSVNAFRSSKQRVMLWSLFGWMCWSCLTGEVEACFCSTAADSILEL